MGEGLERDEERDDVERDNGTFLVSTLWDSHDVGPGDPRCREGITGAIRRNGERFIKEKSTDRGG